MVKIYTVALRRIELNSDQLDASKDNCIKPKILFTSSYELNLSNWSHLINSVEIWGFGLGFGNILTRTPTIIIKYLLFSLYISTIEIFWKELSFIRCDYL